MANDMFLKISGPDVKGESADKSHKDEIELLSFHWSGQSPTDAMSGVATGRFNSHPVVVTKKVDLATPMLAKSAAEHQTYKEVTATIRRPGPDSRSIEYLKVKLTNATVSSIDLAVDHTTVDTSHSETIMFAFQKIEIIYLTKHNTSVSFEYDWDQRA